MRSAAWIGRGQKQGAGWQCALQSVLMVILVRHMLLMLLLLLLVVVVVVLLDDEGGWRRERIGQQCGWSGHSSRTHHSVGLRGRMGRVRDGAHSCQLLLLLLLQLFAVLLLLVLLGVWLVFEFAYAAPSVVHLLVRLVVELHFEPAAVSRTAFARYYTVEVHHCLLLLLR